MPHCDNSQVYNSAKRLPMITVGHLASDQYLKAVARLLKTVFNWETDIMAQYGGEKFIFLISNSTLEQTDCLSEDTRSRIQNFKLEYEGATLTSTINLGIASGIPFRKNNPQKLVSEADKALYPSKTNGRNQVTFSS